MTGQMSRQETFLKSVLNEANLHKRQQQLQHAKTDQINAVCELLMNNLRGAVPKGRQTLRRFKPHAKTTPSHCQPTAKYKKATWSYDALVTGQCVARIATLLSPWSNTVSLLENKVRRQALLDRLLCVVLGILSLADMLKELQQKLKQKFRSLFQRKV